MPGEGVEFLDGTKGAPIPEKYISAVETGIREAFEAGVLAGYPLVDVMATLVDGSSHDIDSSDVAFKIAASMAAREGAARAKPVLLEPIMAVEVVVPEQLMDEIAGDLSSRRGRILAMDSGAGGQVINARVPLAQMLGYSADLRSKTQGRASYTMEFFAFVPVSIPPDPDGNEPVSLAMRVA